MPCCQEKLHSSSDSVDPSLMSMWRSLEASSDSKARGQKVGAGEVMVGRAFEEKTNRKKSGQVRSKEGTLDCVGKGANCSGRHEFHRNDG